MPDYRHVSPAEVGAVAEELRGVYAAVFSQPPYDEGPEMVDKFVGWLAEESKRPGFSLLAAYDGPTALGFAYGYTMPAGEWWHRTNRPAPEGIREADKFAVMEWAVLPDRRGAGIGRRLLEGLLIKRRERYATLTVNAAAEARAIYGRWGWQQVASTKPGKMPGMAVMLLDLNSLAGRQQHTSS